MASQAAVAETPARKKTSSQTGDQIARLIALLFAISLLGIALLLVFQLWIRSGPAREKLGFGFLFSTEWNPVTEEFGALPFLYGTVVTSLVAMLISVPLGLGAAIFLSELAPAKVSNGLTFVIELLAAIPSVIYGLLAIFTLVPLMREYVNPLLIKTLGWTGLFVAPDFGIGMFAAGVILAIMILPIISSLTREVMTAVPHAQREAVLALGATRWEMIRMGVLRNARIGIVGSIILGLGRALGETMAVAMVIGSSPTISKSLLAPAATMASVIANEFAEASDDTYRSALIEIGLALFLVTIVVNMLARLLVWAVTRGAPARVT